ncbi:MAG TPA: protein kinase [Euzebyales bacterium]
MAVPGDVIGGRYELLSRLGRGGMAEVFRAHDQRLGRQVAVKVLAPHLLADARSIERFGREARAAASLNHPNIVNVFDAVNDGDTHAIVMELVEGPTLADVIEQDGQMDVADATQTAIGICDALQAAHDRGLVHHDVKPRNVLFDADGALKVTDFGIARAASSDITTIQGSPPYLAPEQARGGQSDRRSDVYALGCVLFEMLAGRPPFDGDSSSAIVMAHIDAPVPPLSEFRPDAPRDLEQVVNRALAKDPAARYDSAAALRADLTRIAGGLAPLGATIVSSTRAMPADATMAVEDEWTDEPAEYTDRYDEPPPRRRRRMTARAVAIALGVVLLLVVLAMAWADNAQPDVAQNAPVASEPAPEPEPDTDTGDGTADGGNQGGLIDDLNRRADQLEDLLQRGRDADEATRRRIDELERQLQDALDQAAAAAGGNDQGNGANENGTETGRLDELQRRIDDLTQDQQVTDRIVEQIQQILNDLNPFNS